MKLDEKRIENNILLLFEYQGGVCFKFYLNRWCEEFMDSIIV